MTACKLDWGALQIHWPRNKTNDGEVLFNAPTIRLSLSGSRIADVILLPMRKMRARWFVEQAHGSDT
jgi:hypothetical protein